MSRARRRASQTLQFRASYVLGVLVALASMGIAAGCESTPVRALEGARHYSAGTEALNEGRGAKAIEELEQAAALVPQASEIQNHLGLAYWSDGRIDAARAAFERAIELDCDNLAARANLDHLTASASIEVGAQSAQQGREDGG
jgi:Flp pilus assembly protein TadD